MGSYNFWLPRITSVLQKAEAIIVKSMCEIFLCEKLRNFPIDFIVMSLINILQAAEDSFSQYRIISLKEIETNVKNS